MLVLRSISVQNQNCQLCGLITESTSHLLVDCEYSKKVYQWILKWCRVQDFSCGSVMDINDYAAFSGNCTKKGHPLSDLILHRMEPMARKKQ